MEKLKINQRRCKGCKLCVSVCPKKILELDKNSLNSKGYHPVFITDLDKCIRCAFCATICPDSVFELSEQDNEKKNHQNNGSPKSQPVPIQEVDSNEDSATPKAVIKKDKGRAPNERTFFNERK